MITEAEFQAALDADPSDHTTRLVSQIDSGVAPMIDALTAEFARLDAIGAAGYVSHEGDGDEWPTVGFRAGGGGHAVISVHPDDIERAVAALRQFDDGAANISGPESWSYNPQRSLQEAGVRCEWHV